MTLRVQSLLAACVCVALAIVGGYQLASQCKADSGPASESHETQHVATQGTYEGAPELLSADAAAQHEFPACPVCANSDSAHKHDHPCQRRNIKKDLYRGIEVGDNRWIQMACDEAHQSVKEGGGPFGAVILQIDDDSNEVIRFWRGRNLVTKNTDPTAHAEVSVVRTAANELGVFNLGRIHRDDPQLKLPQPGETSHCEIYSSCEPCPMCYAAIRWARIDTIVFAATRFDAAEPGVDFSDLDLYRELATRYEDRQHEGLRVLQSTTTNSLDAFNLWKNSDTTAY